MQAHLMTFLLAGVVLLAGCTAPEAEPVDPNSQDPADGDGDGLDGADMGNATAPVITEETVIAEGPLSLVGVGGQEFAFEMEADAPVLIIQAIVDSAAALDLHVHGPGTCAPAPTTGQLTLVQSATPVERVCGEVAAGAHTMTAALTAGTATGTFRVIARPLGAEAPAA